MSSNISENLKKLRKLVNINISDLAKMLEISINSINKYEFVKNIPPLKNLIKFSKFYEFSIDFLILWNKTLYVKNIKLLSLAQKIDNMEFESRNRIEGSALSLLAEKSKKKTKLDKLDVDLTGDIHKNIEILREKKEISQKELAELLKVNQSQIAHYQNKSIPPVEKLIKLSEIFNISIHALTTSEKLNFNFKDGHFGDTMLLADQLLPLEEHKMLIHFMEAIIKNP